MSNEKLVGLIAGVVALLSTAAGGVWYASAQDAKVTTVEERQQNIITSQEAAVVERAELRSNTIILQQHHIAENAEEIGIEKGREALFMEMCDDGRLGGKDCDEE